MIVTRATTEEWPAIEALRLRYFVGWNAPIQPRDDATIWMVALDADGVAGVYSYTDHVAFGQRWAQDFYLAKGERGKRAAAAMWAQLRASARGDGLALMAAVHPNNFRQLRAMHRRGFRPVALTMMLS